MAGQDHCPSETVAAPVDSSWPASGDWIGWASTWEARMQAFFPQRQVCIAAILDVLAELLPPGPSRILDLGAGAGGLSRAILARFPEASVTALDLDPVLMTIGKGALTAAGSRLTWRQVDLRAPGWSDHVADDAPFDAVVSLATLHHFTRRELGGIYAALARLIRPGGILINAEGLAAGPPDSFLARRFDEARRRGSPPADGWWEAISADPGLTEAVAARESLKGQMRGAGPRLSAESHLRALRRAGFQEAVVAWRYLDEAAVVGLR